MIDYLDKRQTGEEGSFLCVVPETQESILVGKHSYRQGRKELVDHLSPRFRKTVSRNKKWGQALTAQSPPPKTSLLLHDSTS